MWLKSRIWVRDPATIVTILVPIALFAPLSWQDLGTRIEGLWGHRFFELIQILFDWLFENKEILNGSQNVRADCWHKNMKQLCPAVLSGF